jgi:hypothetical protein
MTMQPDPDRFLERFRHFGAQPDVARYLALFHPDATLFDSGMERPITVPEIPEHIEAILKLAPDFRMTPERWRLRGTTIFVEAHNQATLRDQRVEWPSVYVIDLRGDQVIRGRRYYDRRPLVSRVFPGVAPEAPAVPHLDLELLGWAGDETLRFLEWRAKGSVGGKPIEFGIAERLDGSGTRLYFDTLAFG